MQIEQLKSEFNKRFECEPKWIVRCPGRVNLIGEHIDYSGYGVLPMAIDAETVLLVSERDSDEIHFQNTDSKFGPHVHKHDAKWIGTNNVEWYHYFLSGWKGVIDRFELSPRGINVLLSGTIPPSAGLSSSSSIVCSAALATLALYTGETFELISKVELAELCARIERYVGSEGGGMDQAIEILAEAGSAMRIDFDPLRFIPVQLPEHALFAVVHSGTMLNKAATSQYNERVVECRLAAQLIAKYNAVDATEDWRSVRTLRQAAEFLGKDPEEMLAIVDEVLQLSVYSKTDLLEVLKMTDNEFRCTMLTPNTQHMDEFKLMQRARHVYGEAQRVELFQRACEDKNLSRMGQLMNESHQSCRVLYECSCEELDIAVENCLANGALGARLTGAGWGGCAVALFRSSIDNFDVLFTSRPAAGIKAISCDRN